MFRVGRCDEPLALRGITHLLEHVLLHAVHDHDRDLAAIVRHENSAFSWTGERERVLGHLSGLAAAIADLAPVAAIDDEVRILRIEGDEPSRAAGVLQARYGSAGFGAQGWRQFGLDWVDEPELRRWAAAYFSRDNAFVWMTGPPPAELDLPLPAGERRLPPALELSPGLRLPAQCDFDDEVVVVSFTGERSQALHCALGVAGERAHQRLRFALCLTYGVDEDYDRLDAGTAHAALEAACLDEDAGRVRDELLAVLHDLARDGPTQDELDTYRGEILGDYYDAPWLLERRGLDELLGRPPSDRRADVIALTSRSVADALGAALETRIVLAPESLAPADGYHDGDGVAVEPVKGRVHRAREDDAQLTVGSDGVTWDDQTTRFESVAAAVRGVSGALLLIGRDRSWMGLAEKDWEDGAELVAAVEAALPDGIVIPARRR